jgi:hypothetical protein
MGNIKVSKVAFLNQNKTKNLQFVVMIWIFKCAYTIAIIQ